MREQETETSLSANCLDTLCQVASQQGQYLARCFNTMKDAEENPEGPIRIREEGRHRFRPFRFLSFPSLLCILFSVLADSSSYPHSDQNVLFHVSAI
jgi:hypothetical protein